MDKKLVHAAVAALGIMGAGAAQAAVTVPFADVVVLMDESGSMAGEQAWIKPTITTLDGKLVTAGLTPNQYASVGFGASAATGPGLTRYFNVPGPGTSPNVAGLTRPFGTAADFQTLGYTTSGSTEDGWAAINAANALSFRAGAGRNYILVSDENRDSTSTSNTLTYAGVLASLTSTGTLLNAIVDATFRCGSVTANVLGIDSDGTGYVADGAGGYTTGANGVAVSGSGIADYVNLALASGGAAWNLNLLRAGGSTATSFTAAFVDIKVQEITTPPGQIPEPSTYALMLAGLGLLGFMARRKRG
jgi:hypothetical protein